MLLLRRKWMRLPSILTISRTALLGRRRLGVVKTLLRLEERERQRQRQRQRERERDADSIFGEKKVRSI